MIYIGEFSFIERITEKKIIGFFEEFEHTDFIYQYLREGVTLKKIVVKIEYDVIKEIISEEDIPAKELESDWKFDKKQLTASDTEFDYTVLAEEGYFDKPEFYDFIIYRAAGQEKKQKTVLIRYIKDNSEELSNQKQYQLFYSLYFEHQFSSIQKKFIKMIKNRRSEYDLEEYYDFYEIMYYERPLIAIISEYIEKETTKTQYILEIEMDLLTRTKKLFENLKKEFPSMYYDLVDKHPLDFKSMTKIQWNADSEAFFELIRQLKAAKIITDFQGKKLKNENLAQILSKSFQFSPKSGENLDYTPETLQKKFGLAARNKNYQKSDTPEMRLTIAIRDFIDRTRKLE